MLCDTALFGDDVHKDLVDFTGHSCSITADVEVSLVFGDELVDLVGVVSQLVLNIDLLLLLS